jgi:hypothetical protein
MHTLVGSKGSQAMTGRFAVWPWFALRAPTVLVMHMPYGGADRLSRLRSEQSMVI